MLRTISSTLAAAVIVLASSGAGTAAIDDPAQDWDLNAPAPTTGPSPHGGPPSSGARPGRHGGDALTGAYWYCHGHDNTPFATVTGIGFDGYQDCEGAFDVQKVCVKLQEWDRFTSVWYDRTSYRCSAETVAPHSYSGSAVTCTGAQEGTFRTYGKGYAWPDGVQVTDSGWSTGIHMCNGY